MPTATIEGEERSYCADCFWKLQKEYEQKKNCEECAYLSKDKCRKTDVTLTPTAVGYNTFFLQAENCKYFSSEKDAFVEQAKKLEAQGHFEEAAAEYDKLGMTEEAEAARKKQPQTAASSGDVKAQVEALAKKGKTITFYCCHCGMPIKIGAKQPQIQKTCPRCHRDLEAIDLGKLIKQHSA